MSVDTMSELGLDIGLSTMLRDEPGYRIAFDVEAFPSDDGMEMVLRTADSITWWKSLSYFPALQGGFGLGPEIRIETRDQVHEASQLLLGSALTASGVFQLWKGGFANFGAFAGSVPVNAWSNRGRRLIFTWHQD